MQNLSYVCFAIGSVALFIGSVAGLINNLR